MESFFSSLKSDLDTDQLLEPAAVTAAQVTDYIDNFYNPERKHSTLDYLSPIKFELTYQPAQQSTKPRCLLKRGNPSPTREEVHMSTSHSLPGGSMAISSPRRLRLSVAAALAGSALMIGSPAPAEVLFAASYLGIDAGLSPRCVAIGDWNGDGTPDLAVVNVDGNTLTVLLGNGDGSFGARNDYETGEWPCSVAMGDFDEDGNPDLVLVSDGSLSVLLGNGDGTFEPGNDYYMSGSVSVAVGDLDGDGVLDLVATDGVNMVGVLLGNGDGTFRPKVDYGTGSNPCFVTIGDLNGDGQPDLAVANYSDNSISVLLNNGDGTFGTKHDYGTGSRPTSVAVGDLNGDAKPDLATANYYSSTVSVLLGNGDGTFGTKHDFDTGTDPYTVAIADFNRDGSPDLAVANYDSTVSVLLGNGDGTFGMRCDYGTGGGSFVAIGDLNGDEMLDLVVAGYFTTVSVLLGNGDGTFGTRNDYATRSYPFSVAIGDLNGDWKSDLAVANSQSHTVSVLLGNGTGGFGTANDFGTGNFPKSVAIGDLNGDGKSDLVTANGTSTVSVLLGRGDGTFWPRHDYGTGNDPWSVAIGDLSGDGRPDVVVANLYYYMGSTVSVLLGNGDGTLGIRHDYTTGLAPFSVAIGDLNGDGKPDLAVANHYDNTASVLLGNGDGSFQPKVDYGTGTRPSSVAIGDLNRDGKPDLAVANSDYGHGSTVSVLLNNGGGTFGAKSDYGTGLGPSSVAIGALDGDEELDLAVANQGITNNGNTVSVLRGNGDGTFRAKNDYGAGRSAISVAIGDLNGDARQDLAVANYYGDTVSALINIGLANPAGAFSPAWTERASWASIYPNPACGPATFRFAVPRAGIVRVGIYDIVGHLVRTALDQGLAPGVHTVPWDTRDDDGLPVPAGVYYCQIRVGGEKTGSRITILR